MAAQNAAHEAANDEITPDHLLLGLLDDPAALAPVLLHLQKVDTEALRAAVELPPPSSAHPPTSSRSADRHAKPSN